MTEFYKKLIFIGFLFACAFFWARIIFGASFLEFVVILLAFPIIYVVARVFCNLIEPTQKIPCASKQEGKKQ